MLNEEPKLRIDDLANYWWFWAAILAFIGLFALYMRDEPLRDRERRREIIKQFEAEHPGQRLLP